MVTKQQTNIGAPETADLMNRARKLFGKRFVIERLVAATPNRALFLSRDILLNRHAALRVHLKPDTRSRAWFEREIQLLAQLDHPSLRTIYTAGYEDNWAYSAAQWIDGESLDEAVARGSRPIPTVYQLAFDLAEAIEYAHSEDVIVRRIVPTTIMLDQLRRAIITDLRFSNSCLDVAGQDDHEAVDPYLAPEARSARPAERSSDIYTIGALLYFAATGSPPDADPEKIVRPQVLRPTCPKSLQDVITRAMSKKPGDRFLSGTELVEDLSAAVGEHDFHAPVASRYHPGELPEEFERRLRRALGDDYELLSELGAGGFGRVYRVLDLRLEREVALKVLHPHLAADRSLVDRFEREARLAAQLNHHNIISIHDIGGRSGFIWYTMAYVHGNNLARIVSETGPQPVVLVVRWLQQALDALSHAHSQHIVHRDIKPENVLISSVDESLHIADFGLAMAIQASGVLGGASSRSGTPEFAAPEQLLGEQVDARTDLYSLSLVAIFALLGHAPFTGPTVEAILAQQTTKPVPDVAVTRSDVPPSLAGVLQRGAAAEVDKRFNSAAEYSEELAKIVADLGGAHVDWVERTFEV